MPDLVLYKVKKIKSIFCFFYDFTTLCSVKYREFVYLDKRTGKSYKSLNFWNKSLPILTEFYNIFFFILIKLK